ncbi:MAG: hypothetical protein PHR09_04190 [Bacilli bacterium]|nr:hypothetical protein [Bacilli bacterium]
MKKLILGFVALFAFGLSVLAADNDNELIELKEIKISNYEVAPFDGKLEINYELVPNDVENKNIVWTISGLKQGLIVEFEGESKTNKAVGTIVLIVKNDNEDISTVKLNAKSGDISKSVSIKVENETTTEDRYKKDVVEDIEKLIEDAKNIDEKNEEAIEKAIKNIDIMLKNEDVKNAVDKDLLEDYDGIKEKFDTYKEEDNKDYAKTVIIVGLVLAFLFGIYMIFKDNNKPVKKEVKKEVKKQDTKPKSKKK